MKYEIKNSSTLKVLLWLDFFLGCSTAIVGLIFFGLLTNLLGLTTNLIVTVSVITFLYSIVALVLTTQKNTSIPLLRILIYANWLWAFVSIVLLLFHFEKATVLGQTFLILQILVVGGLAYYEGNQVLRKPV